MTIILASILVKCSCITLRVAVGKSFIPVCEYRGFIVVFGFLSFIVGFLLLSMAKCTHTHTHIVSQSQPIVENDNNE